MAHPLREECPLGIDCDFMDNVCPEEQFCVNFESCLYWSEPWDLYEIVLFPDIPPIYLHVPKTRWDWCEEKWGFKEISNLDWVLYLAAKSIPFPRWREYYYKMRSWRGFVRTKDFEILDSLREEVDEEYRAVEDGIPF